MLPSIVLANDDFANTKEYAIRNNHLGNMMKIILQPPIPLPAVPLARMLVEPLIDTLDYATIDQYGSVLVGSYRTKRIQPNVNTTDTFCLASALFKQFFILNLNHEATGLWCDYHLLELTDTLDFKTSVGWRNHSLLQGFLLDGFVVENYLCKSLLVVRGSWFLLKTTRITIECFECFLEVPPIGNYFADRLLGGFRIMEVLETLLLLNEANQSIYVGQWSFPILGFEIVIPLPPHIVIALVVEFFACSA